jgi:nucleoside-diphosphate-sugar epimerase
VPLKEEDAYPAEPQDAYGWEKLVRERLCIHYRQDYGLETRIVRFHNIFGPLGTWMGGREKAPAALCRKIAASQLHDWKASMKLKFGVMASKRGPSVTSMIALPAYTS